LVDTAPTDVTVRPNLDDPALFHGEDIGLFHTEPALSVPEKPTPKARRTPVRARAAKEPYGPPAPYGPPRPESDDLTALGRDAIDEPEYIDPESLAQRASRDGADSPDLSEVQYGPPAPQGPPVPPEWATQPWRRYPTEQLRGTTTSAYPEARRALEEQAAVDQMPWNRNPADRPTATRTSDYIENLRDQEALDDLDMAARDMDAEGGMAPTTPTGWHSDVNWSTPLFQVGDAVEHQGLKLPADQGFRFQMPPPPDYIPRDTGRLPPLPPEPTAPAPRPLVTPRDILVPAAAGLGVGTALSFSSVNAPESEPMPSDLQRLDRVQQAIRALRGGAL
jgi:hypothetical protein